MAEKVERVHADKATCPRGLAKQLKPIRLDLEKSHDERGTDPVPDDQAGMGRQAAGPILQWNMSMTKRANSWKW